MKPFQFLALAACVLQIVIGADKKCDRGIRDPDPHTLACCAPECGDLCGAWNCSERGADKCCSKNIYASKRSCDDHEAPCLKSAAYNDECQLGIRHPDPYSSACCANWCGGRCGSGDCRLGGEESCCGEKIIEKNRSCSSNLPPCVVTNQAQSYDASPDRNCYSIGGILSDDNKTCCPKSCGKCGGTGCAEKYGGADKCCQGPVEASGRQCLYDDPPCMQKSAEAKVDVNGFADVYVGGGGGLAATVGNNASGSVKRFVAITLYTAPYTSVKEREDRMGGVQFDGQMIYRTIDSLGFSGVKEILDSGRIAIINIEFLKWDRPQLPVINSGAYDWVLKEFAINAAKDGRPFWVRSLHEINGVWYPWCLWYAKENTPEEYSKAWRRIVGIFKDAGAYNVKFELNVNVENPFDDKTPFGTFVRPEMPFDAIGISYYNRAYTDEWHQYTESFYDGFKKGYDQVAALNRPVPINVAETSTTSFKTDKPKWIRDAMRSVAVDFPRVKIITWFLENKKGFDWDLNSQAEYDGMRDGIIECRDLTQ